MKNHLTLILIILLGIVPSTLVRASELPRVNLDGKLLSASFDATLPRFGKNSIVPPSSGWKASENFEFGLKGQHGVIYGGIFFVKRERPAQQNINAILLAELNELVNPRFDQVGEIMKVLDLGDQKVPIMSHGSKGYDFTSASFYLDGYWIAITLAQDGSYKRGGYARCMEKIIRTLKIHSKS